MDVINPIKDWFAGVEHELRCGKMTFPVNGLSFKVILGHFVEVRAAARSLSSDLIRLLFTNFLSPFDKFFTVIERGD